MIPEELRTIMAYLSGRVHLGSTADESPLVITFDAPTEDEMINAGLFPEGVKRIRCAPWWDEMVTDILETPDYCEPEDSPHQVLEYARDVVSDYIRKRVPLNGE